MRTTLHLSLILILLSGCISTQEWLKTKPENFQLGYKKGCLNGEDMASNSYVEKLNETDTLYKDDEVYREAWDDGYETCYSDREVDIMMMRRRF